jgi:GAF domain-containing protein
MPDRRPPAPRVGPASSAWAQAYRSALRSYMNTPGEELLLAGYELGRDAVRRHLGVLELASTHHAALAAALAAAGGETGGDTGAAIVAAGEFFGEALAAFEMVQRGFGEAQEAALLERLQSKLLRRLSSFLADTSLAVDTADATGEVLQLVAEHALELLPAGLAVAVARDAAGGTTRTAAFGPAALPDADTLLALERRAHRVGRCVREADAETRRRTLAAPLTALDGAELGAILVFGREGGRPSGDLDEALLSHLAEMAAAALERAYLRGASTPAS